MKIYTKTGDKGKTKLIGGSSIAKSDSRLEAYGNVDELNSVLGLLVIHLGKEQKFKDLQQQILRLQNELFNLGSLLACEDLQLAKKLPGLENQQVTQLENSIDQMSSTLPELKNFILPGGSEPAALFHLARTVCRRTERATVKLFEKQADAKNEIAIIYLNRLSDYFFVAARFCNHSLGLEDRLWQK